MTLLPSPSLGPFHLLLSLFLVGLACKLYHFHDSLPMSV